MVSNIPFHNGKPVQGGISGLIFVFHSLDAFNYLMASQLPDFFPYSAFKRFCFFRVRLALLILGAQDV